MRDSGHMKNRAYDMKNRAYDALLQKNVDNPG